MARLMPPDLPNGGSDITTKLLRPELVQTYSVPISSDGFSSILTPPQNEASEALLDDMESNDVDAGCVLLLLASLYLQCQKLTFNFLFLGHHFVVFFCIFLFCIFLFCIFCFDHTGLHQDIYVVPEFQNLLRCLILCHCFLMNHIR